MVEPTGQNCEVNGNRPTGSSAWWIDKTMNVYIPGIPTQSLYRCSRCGALRWDTWTSNCDKCGSQMIGILDTAGRLIDMKGRIIMENPEFNDILADALARQKAEETIPVIRCKNCKYWEPQWAGSYGRCRSAQYGHVSNTWEITVARTHGPDWYCADGKPRVDD